MPTRLTTTNQKVYVPSGNISPKAYLLTALAFLVALPLAGILYALLIWFIPIVYFNLFISFGFGMLMGLLIMPIVRWGHVRSYKFEIITTILLALGGIYFSWAAHLTLVANITGESGFFNTTAFHFNEFFLFVLQPVAMAEFIQEVAKYGTWGIGFTDSTVNGVFLWIVWIIEAGIILFAAFRINQGWSNFPYSEMAGTWYQQNPLNKKIKLQWSTKEFEDAIVSNNMSVFEQAEQTDGIDMEFTDPVIFTAQGDSGAYIAFYNKTLKTNDDGKKEEQYDLVSNFYKLTKEQREKLTSVFG